MIRPSILAYLAMQPACDRASQPTPLASQPATRLVSRSGTQSTNQIYI